MIGQTILLNKINNYSINNFPQSIILEGEKPILIDEWQEATNLWDEIRIDVDKTGLNTRAFDVKVIDAIPTLPSGKLNYQLLQTMI